MTTQTVNSSNRLSSFNSEKVSVRLPQWQKDILDFVSETQNISQTDVIRNSLNTYFLQGSTSNVGALRHKTKEKYVQMDLFEWAEKNQKTVVVDNPPSFEDVQSSTVVSVEEIPPIQSTKRDPFLDFYYGKQ